MGITAQLSNKHKGMYSIKPFPKGNYESRLHPGIQFNYRKIIMNGFESKMELRRKHKRYVQMKIIYNKILHEV